MIQATVKAKKRRADNCGNVTSHRTSPLLASRRFLEPQTVRKARMLQPLQREDLSGHSDAFQAPLPSHFPSALGALMDFLTGSEDSCHLEVGPSRPVIKWEWYLLGTDTICFVALPPALLSLPQRATPTVSTVIPPHTYEGCGV